MFIRLSSERDKQWGLFCIGLGLGLMLLALQPILVAAGPMRDSDITHEVLVALATNLEHIGDMIERSLALLIAKKTQQQVHFSAADKEEIKQLYLCVQTNMKLAFSVFLSGDLNSARNLLEQKTEVRDLEYGAVNRHQKRLREQGHQDINISALYLDILRDLKRINSCLVSVAYPILDQAGELRDSRLRVSHS